MERTERAVSISTIHRTEDIFPTIEVYHLYKDKEAPELRTRIRGGKKKTNLHLPLNPLSTLSITIRSTNPVSPPSGYIISVSAPVQTY